MSPTTSALDSLLQHDSFVAHLEQPVRSGWVTVFDSFDTNPDNFALHCALVPLAHVPRSLQDPSWDLLIGDGMPGCNRHREPGGEETVTYLRFGELSGIEPLVIHRNYHGVRPGEVEICEEFRLFHNLWRDPKSGDYWKFDEAGNEEVVIRGTGRRIEVRVKELRQFLAIKEMAAVLQVDSVRYSQLNLEDVPASDQERSGTSDAFCYTFHVAPAHAFSEGRSTFSRLLGKRIIAPLPKSESGIWPYSEDRVESFPDFTIGTDESGSAIKFTCDPDKLANYFGKNPDAPHYLTPVYFKREVLLRYYNEPQKYSVDDGFLWCASLWRLRMDNHLPDHVAVYLGDLGRDLPESERLHWQLHNVAADAGISRTKFLRDFQAEPADPERPELLLKYRIAQFNRAWEARFQFPLFLPLTPGDAHLLTGLREPLSDSQTEFDGQVLALTKILIDSLNEQALVRGLPALPDGTKGIGKLAAFLESVGAQSRTAAIAFLRELQSLRSTGVGHRKGASYERAAEAFKVAELGHRLAFRAILVRALNDLIEAVGDELLPAGWR